MDPEKKIFILWKNSNKPLKILDFERFKVGEGILK